MNRSESTGFKKKEKWSDLLKEYIPIGSGEDRGKISEWTCSPEASCSISNEESWNSRPSISKEECSNATLLISQNICPDDVLQGGKSRNLPTRGEKKINLGKMKLRLDFSLSKQVDVLEVFSKGTRFMKFMHFPTVIVQLHRVNLKKSRIYYVIVEPEPKECRWKVPCVMFSNPHAHTETRFAELLPLYFLKCSNSVNLSPMLLRKRYRRIFDKGCSFNIQWLKAGRAFDGSGGKLWKMYDVRNREMQNLIKGFIEQDINKMFLLMTKTTNSLVLSSKHYNGVSGDETRVLRKPNSSDCFEFEERLGSQEIITCKPRGLCEYEKVSRAVCEGRGLEKGSKYGIRERCIYKSRCERGKTIRKDSFSFKSVKELDEYWRISGKRS